MGTSLIISQNESTKEASATGNGVINKTSTTSQQAAEN